MELFAGVPFFSESSEIAVYNNDSYSSFYTDAKSLRCKMQMQVDVIQVFTSIYVKFCRRS